MVQLQPFWCNLLSKCALQPKIQKNSLKPLILEVQDRSRSSMLINLKNPSKVLVMVCSKSIPICNCFHTKKANRGKIMTLLWEYPSLMLSFERNPLTQGHEQLSLITRVLGVAHSENFLILAITILKGLKGVTGRTHRWTDGQVDGRAGHS